MGIQLAKPVRIESCAARSIVSDTRIPAAEITRPNTIHPAGASLGAGRIAHCTVSKMGFHPDRNYGVLTAQGYRDKAMQMHEPRRQAGIRWISIKCKKQEPNALWLLKDVFTPANFARKAAAAITGNSNDWVAL